MNENLLEYLTFFSFEKYFFYFPAWTFLFVGNLSKSKLFEQHFNTGMLILYFARFLVAINFEFPSTVKRWVNCNIKGDLSLSDSTRNEVVWIPIFRKTQNQNSYFKSSNRLLQIVPLRQEYQDMKRQLQHVFVWGNGLKEYYSKVLETMYLQFRLSPNGHLDFI